MADYSITFARSARKELEVLSNPLITRSIIKIEALSKTPRPSGCRKLRGSNDLWRIRVGDYRVTYSINEDLRLIDVVAIRHRSRAYE